MSANESEIGLETEIFRTGRNLKDHLFLQKREQKPPKRRCFSKGRQLLGDGPGRALRDGQVLPTSLTPWRYLCLISK